MNPYAFTTQKTHPFIPKFTKLNFLIVLLLTTVLLPSCSGLLKSYIREDDSQIPMGFGKDNPTIVAMKHSASHDQNVDKRLKKYYTGPYVFASEQELSTTYKDTLKYRYILDNSSYTYNSSPEGARPQDRMPSATSVSFYLKDRVTGKIYMTDVSSGMQGNVLKAYLERLEEIRNKNLQLASAK